MTNRTLSPRKPANAVKPAKTDKPTKDEKATSASDQEIVITRVFEAPRTIVFKAWTDPKHLAAWWGPRGFTNPRCEVDVRAGGLIRIDMQAPNGTVYPMAGIYLEIKEPEQIVFTTGALDDKGVQLFEFLHTVTFAEQNGKTTLTIRSRVTRASDGAEKYIGGFEAGMTQSLEKLDGHLVHRGEPIILDRTLNAPVARVWQALTDKNEFKHWFFDIAEFKAEVGFEFKFSGCGGKQEFIHRCKITEVIPNKKLAYTWRYEGYPGDSLVIIELSAHGEQTHLKLTHEGLETMPKTPHFARTNFFEGWTMIIGSNLKKHVEENLKKTTSGSKNISITTDREIIITRVVSAPREMVWDAMTDPKKVVNWWGPVGFSTTIETMDVRPGGTWKHVMRGPDGTNYPNQSTFKEVVKPERIVYSHGGRREGGPGISFVATWTFETVETNKTKVTIHQVFPTAEQRDFVVKEFGAIEGGKQTLGRLDEFVSKNNPTTKSNDKNMSTNNHSASVQPYLIFDGRCDEALEFYKKALGIKIEMLMRFKDSPDQSMVTPESLEKVMHCSFTFGNTTVMASDGHCAGKAAFQGFSLSLNVHDEVTAKKLYAALSEGGQVQMPLTKTFFSPCFGMVTDKFGMSWMVHVPGTK